MIFEKRCRELFRKSIVKGPGGCWDWTGAVDRHGYGRFYVKQIQQTLPAHHFTWRIANGRKVPKGFDTHHLCGRKLCVNPEHISILSHQEHMQLHSKEDNLWSGSRNSQSKYDDQLVFTIKLLHRIGLSSAPDLAKLFNLPQRTVYHFTSKKGWAHLEPFYFQYESEFIRQKAPFLLKKFIEGLHILRSRAILRHPIPNRHIDLVCKLGRLAGFTESELKPLSNLRK